jgi:plastocyanin
VASRALTPTLIVCLAGAVAGGIALARPPSTPATATLVAPDTTGTGPDRGPTSSAAHGAHQPAPKPRSSESAAKPSKDAPVLTISGFAFGEPLTVPPGAKVTVRNADRAPHTVTAAGGAFDTRTIAPGATASFVAPSKPGTYRFACAIHPSMTGSLVVAG